MLCVGLVQLSHQAGRPNHTILPTIWAELKKARSRSGSLSRILVREGVTPRVSGMFHKAAVQAVLLHGCESWVLTDKV